jgi:hypothetical protein
MAVTESKWDGKAVDSSESPTKQTGQIAKA